MLTEVEILAARASHGKANQEIKTTGDLVGFARKIEAMVEAKVVQGGSGNIDMLTDRVVEWADSVFPDRVAQSALLKLFEETGELVKNPTSSNEYADICIMLFDLANMHGVDLAKAITDKLAVNRERNWGFTAVGTLQHTDEGGDDVVATTKAEVARAVAMTRAYDAGLSDRLWSKPLGHNPCYEGLDTAARHWYALGWHMGGIPK